MSYSNLPAINSIHLSLNKPTGFLFGETGPQALLINAHYQEPGEKTRDCFVTRLILSYIDGTTWKNLTVVNKTWYEAIRGRSFLKQILPGQKISGRFDQYFLIHSPTRRELNVVFKQTGLKISLPAGQTQLTDYAIAHGQYGAFYIGYAHNKDHYVGIKVTQGSEAVESETKTQEALSHFSPHIMPLFDSAKGVNKEFNITLYQIMKLAGLGSANQLRDFVNNFDALSKKQTLFCIAEVLFECLDAMHQNNYCHLDLKPHNVVIAATGQPYVIDFGCSEQRLNGLVEGKANGDRDYFAPERWLANSKGTKFDGFKADMWSIGLILLMLERRGGHPFIAEKMQSKLESQKALLEYVEKEVDAIDPNASQDSFLGLIKQLLAFDPNTRLSARNALTHPWFVEMKTSSASWKANILGHLQELVQSLYLIEQTKKHNTSYNLLSPQEHPFPHFMNFIPRLALFTQLKDSLLNSNASLTTCQGVAGSGKTQLITHLIYQKEIQDRFGLILWFREAGNLDLLDQQYHILARELELCDASASAEEAFKAVSDYLASYLQVVGKPWLIVYDNGRLPTVLQHRLPARGGHIVITTRETSETERQANIIGVGMLSEQEALALAHKILPTNDSQTDRLCKELGYHPQAISQACAFIRNQHPTMTVVSYLSKLKVSPKILDENPRLFGIKSPSSVFGLWDETLKTLKEKFSSAFGLLEMLSYVEAGVIPPQLVEGLIQQNKKDWEKLLDQGLIQNTTGGFFMHPLLQLRVRYQHTDSVRNEYRAKLIKTSSYKPSELTQPVKNQPGMPGPSANPSSNQASNPSPLKSPTLITLPHSTPVIPAMAFGKAKWMQYFGDIGVEPPLPSNITQILAAPCPFFPGKKVQETHLLTLIPKTVSGKPFTLNSLEELVKKPKQGSATQYALYWDDIKQQYGDTSPQASYWVLFTKDVIPNSRNKSYDAQVQLIATHSQQANIPYKVPHLLEAATSIFMAYMQTGTRLYSDNPYTYTRCQERVSAYPDWLLVVGSFAPGGLRVRSYGSDYESGGVGGSRLF